MRSAGIDEQGDGNESEPTVSRSAASVPNLRHRGAGATTALIGAPVAAIAKDQCSRRFCLLTIYVDGPLRDATTGLNA